MKDEKQAKKQWERPKINVLNIKETFGGTVPAVAEDDTFSGPGTIGS